jgi:hypothetical protein
MLIHIVSFKYKAETPAAQRADHRNRLQALQDLPGVIALHVGEDVVRSPRSYDAGLSVHFTDRSALDAYQKHERHVPVAQFGGSLCEHIVAVDFMV